jgi:hypothetical protein
MSIDRESELIELIGKYAKQEPLLSISELLILRREKYRDKLESQNDEEKRGRAKECKDLLQFIS